MPRAMYAVPSERTPVPAHDHGSNPRSNLPLQPTSLVGREQLIESACAILRNPDVHWLTMSGPPGVGKTRMALRAASSMAGFFGDGVCFVPLASITEPDLVLTGIAQALALKEAGQRAPVDRLKRHLRDRHFLLLLDNLEQVTGAAPLISELLMACPGMKVLATSRTLLRIYGEHDFPVPPLSLPAPAMYNDPDALLQTESVALFVQRAQAARPDFTLSEANARAVAEICVHLEGLPLAIELAAARVRLLPPQAILPRVAQRLQFLNSGALNLPPRQRTLRGAVEWSYSLLDEHEQRLFRTLAAFVGGATLEAIAECGLRATNDGRPATVSKGNTDDRRRHELVPHSALETLSSLMDKSLLRQVGGVGDEPRYAMLETVREYALERLAESGEADAVRLGHALYYMELAEHATAELSGPQQSLWLDRLTEEHDNFRAALEWLNLNADRELQIADLAGTDSVEGEPALEVGGNSQSAFKLSHSTIALRLAVALHPFWEMRGHMAEGRMRITAALASAGPDADREARAQALFAAGRMALVQHDDTAAEPLLEESLALHQELRRKLGTSCALVTLGHLAVRRGDHVKAGEMYEEAFILRTEVGDNLWIARSLAGMGYLAHYRGNYERAITLHEQSLVLSREAGDRNAVGRALVHLAYEVACRGWYERADSLLAEAVQVFERVGSPQGIADCLAIYGKMAHAQGHLEWAVLLFGLSRSMFDAVGLPMEPPSHTDLSEYERAVDELRSRLGSAAFDSLYAEAQRMTPAQVIAYGPRTPPVSVPTRPAPVAAAPTRQAGTSTGYPAGLTPREVEVLRLVACGLTNVEAADKLTVSRHTINMHLRSIYNKLEVTSRLAATRVAMAQGLV